MNSDQIIRLLILSNQQLYLEALKNLLSTQYENFEVGSSIVNQKQSFAVIESENPDVILMDANGKGKEVWDFLKMMHIQFPEVKIVMLANSNEQIYIDYANKNGAAGYILKSSPKELLVAAIKIVVKDGYFYDPGVQKQNPNGYSHKIQGKYNLSNREIEVIQLIKDGNSTKNIADILKLSYHTIESHRKNIYNKLQINKVTDLLRIYREFED